MDKNNDPNKKDEQITTSKLDEQLDTIPGGKIYQFFTKQRHRMLTPNLNRVAMLIIVASILLIISKPLGIGTGQSLYCMECRACLEVGEDCPVNIEPADMVIAAQTSDYRTFIDTGGLLCITCGVCNAYCIVDIDIAGISSTMQDRTMEAMEKGNLPNDLLLDAIEDDNIGDEFIDDVEDYLLEQGVDLE